MPSFCTACLQEIFIFRLCLQEGSYFFPLLIRTNCTQSSVANCNFVKVPSKLPKFPLSFPGSQPLPNLVPRPCCARSRLLVLCLARILFGYRFSYFTETAQNAYHISCRNRVKLISKFEHWVLKNQKKIPRLIFKEKIPKKSHLKLLALNFWRFRCSVYSRAAFIANFVTEFVV